MKTLTSTHRWTRPAALLLLSAGWSCQPDAAPAAAPPAPLQDAGVRTDAGGGPAVAPAAPAAAWPTGRARLEIAFEGYFDPATGLHIQVLEQEVRGLSEGDFRTAHQAAYCTILSPQNTGGVISADTTSIITDPTTIFYGDDCGGPSPQGFRYSDFGDALCADVSITSFFDNVVLRDVYAEINSMQPPDGYTAWTWAEGQEFGLGTGARPPSGNNAPVDTFGLWSYGDLDIRANAPANSNTATWVFRLRDRDFFSFRGRVAAFFQETCNGLDDDCDGAVDEEAGCFDLGDGCLVGEDCASGVCLGDACRGETCANNVQDPGETGVDCGGVCGNSCDEGDPCLGDDDCASGYCVGTCQPEPDQACETPLTFFRDADGDGFGGAASGTVQACSLPAAASERNDDCDDSRADVYPGAPEVCDGVDNNCNGQTDENLQRFCYDGPAGTNAVGPCTGGVQTCQAGDWGSCVGQVLPDAESCDNVDNDCNGLVDDAVTRSCYTGPADTLGVGTCRAGAETCTAGIWGACAGEVLPGPEVCGGVDSNCDGVVDGSDAIGQQTWYRDADGDGFGDAAVTLVACNAPAGWVANNTDCNDTRADAFPGATEVCDGIDNNCDGQIDEGLTTTFFRDLDGDGFGSPASGQVQACTSPGAGWSTAGTDCNDARDDAFPGATEVCDGIDNNCNGTIDGISRACYTGAAGTQNVGPCRGGNQVCSAGNWGSCNGQVLPVAEVCDGIDNNCNGTVDEGVQTTFFRDVDGDGWGQSAQPNGTIQACTRPNGYAAQDGDCDDREPLAHPGRTEVCDGIDNNCNGQIDEGLLITFFRDLDGDGFGSLSSGSIQACSSPGGGWSLLSTDCDDGRTDVFPGAPEVCDGRDNNCNGQIDGISRGCYSGPAGTQNVGICRGGSQVCNAGAWGTCTGQVTPQTETCNNLDDNCNGQVDENVTRSCYSGPAGTAGVGICRAGTQACSAGGWGACSGQVLPTTDICNGGVDDNCDGVPDNQPNVFWWPDRDNDGWGDSSWPVGGTASCTPPWFNARQNRGDCNDYTQYVRPGHPELCDGIDNDCDGAVNDICQSGCQGRARGASSYNTPGLRGYAYCKVGSNRNFDQHQARCWAHSNLMSLSRFNDLAENNWVYDNRPWSFGRMYIGGVFGVSRDLGSIVWRDGSVGGFTNFAPGEPSGNGLCISLYGNSDGDANKRSRWDDHGCGDNRDEGICEWHNENVVLY